MTSLSTAATMRSQRRSTWTMLSVSSLLFAVFVPQSVSSFSIYSKTCSSTGGLPHRLPCTISMYPAAACARTTTIISALYAKGKKVKGDESDGDDDDDDSMYDVAIIGSGPASCSLAALLTATSSSSSTTRTQPPPPRRVVVLSKYANKQWVPNYGCWAEEWAALDVLYAAKGVPGLATIGLDRHWDDTDCFFGEKEEGQQEGGSSASSTTLRRTVGKAYIRISRKGLKQLFYGDDDDDNQRGYDVIHDDVLGEVVNTNVYRPGGSVTMHETCTELTCKDSGQKVRAKIVVDGTGAESPFTIRDGRDREGYQIAYGVECHVDGSGVSETHVGDYDRSKMTLFDFRSNESWTDTASANQYPTFNYVMPLKNNVMFFEETSLVANPAMSFRECKPRLHARLASQNVRITDVLEEEFCYIPMGGGLPRKGQRIVPVGAAAGLVHPSTGYQIGRCLASNLDVCEQILDELSTSSSSFDPDAAAARIIGRTWTPDAMRTRAFCLFGGEYLMKLSAEELQQFFASFFHLDPTMWGAFLSGWKHLPGYEEHQKDWPDRLWFGVSALSKLPFTVAVGMVLSILTYSVKDGIDLLQSVTPFAGEPEAYDTSLEFLQNKGDLEAKAEAMELLCACDRCEEEASVTLQSVAAGPSTILPSSDKVAVDDAEEVEV